MNGAALAASILVTLTRLITGVRARGRDDGPEPGQRVFYANHSSHLDALTIWAALPQKQREITRPVAAADYWDRPGPRAWLARRVLNAVLVDRSDAGGKRKALDSLTQALEDGSSLILFPEGTRSGGSTVGKLRPGLYFIARKRPDVDLVPVYLENLSRILPKGEVLPVPLIGGATFGPALRLNPDESRQAFLERARAALIALMAPS